MFKIVQDSGYNKHVLLTVVAASAAEAWEIFGKRFGWENPEYSNELILVAV